MKKNRLPVLFILLILRTFNGYSTITAVLNLDGSTTPLSTLTTCASNDEPKLKLTLFENGSVYNIPANRTIKVHWFQRTGPTTIVEIEGSGLVLSNTDNGSFEAKCTIILKDIDIQFEIEGWDIQNGVSDRYSGNFFARLEIIDLYQSPPHPEYTSNDIAIVEGQKPIVKINDLYSTSNQYSLLSGCNSGDVNLKLHPSQTCGLDAFGIVIWETDGHGTDIGSHYWRPLTSTEVGNISGSSPPGISIKSINTNVTGGSGNGTITMQAGSYYSIGFGYNGQHTDQITYLSIHYKSGSWDLVISDNSNNPTQFNGYEPLTKWDNNVFQSPYLWNKLSTTGNQNNGNHENPDYSTVNTSKMMFKVTNIGCASSTANTPLKLYWTRARLNEVWAEHWEYDMTNNFITSALTSDPFPAGSEITINSPSFSTPYNSSSDPVLLPAISAGSTYTVTFANGVTWYPPEPGHFDAVSGFMNSSNQWPILCLLARIPDATDPILWEPTGTSDKILDYVKRNNNVATRNTWLVDDPQHIVIREEGGTATGWHHGFATAIVNNPYNHSIRVNICLDLIPHIGTVGDFLDYGSIYIATTTGLNSSWSSGGSLSTNISNPSSTLFTLTDGAHACLSNITLVGGAEEQIGVRYNFDLALLTGSPANFTYQLSMIRLDSIEGGGFDTIMGSNVIYLVEIPTSHPDTSGEGGGDFRVNINEIGTNTNLFLYPNPSQEYITIQMNSESTNESELVLTNNLGEVIRIFKYTMSGEIIEIISTKDLSSGIYYLKYTTNGVTETKKISIVH